MGLITRRDFIFSRALGGLVREKSGTLKAEIMEVFMPTSEHTLWSSTGSRLRMGRSRMY